MKNTLSFSVLFILLSTYSIGFENVNDLFKNLNYGAKSANLTASLELTKTVDNTAPLTGEIFSYTLNYSCSSTTNDCYDVVLEDILPPELEFVSLIGSTHSINESYNSGTHTVTFTFQDVIPAGTFGNVTVNVIFPAGFTPNETVANNTATISSSNAPSVTATNSEAVAVAAQDFNYYKTTSGFGGENVLSYAFKACNDKNYDYYGVLHLDSVIIVDTLLPNAILHEVREVNNYSYDPVTNIVTMYLYNLDIGECRWPKVVVEYPEPYYSANDLIINEGAFTYYPVGEFPETVYDEDQTILPAPFVELEFEKYANAYEFYPGEYGNYGLHFYNRGTDSLYNFCIVDTIPSEIELTQIDHGNYAYNGPRGNVDYEERVTITYTTNLNGSQIVPGSPFSIWDFGSVYLTDLGLNVGGTEYITSVSFCYRDIPSGFFSYDDINLHFRVRDNAPPGIVTNCAYPTSDTDLSPTVTVDCANINVNAPIVGHLPGANKEVWRGGTDYFYKGSFNPGDTVRYKIQVYNSSSVSDPIDNPIMADLLPPELSYITNSWVLTNADGVPQPNFRLIYDYKGTGRTFLQWDWSGSASYSVPPSEFFTIEFDVVIDEFAPAGFETITNEYSILNESSNGCTANSYVLRDTFDFDDDGSTTDLFCSGRALLDINPYPSLESEKLVKGQVDSIYTKYPDRALTIPGGIADYQLYVRNTGNVIMENTTVIDILPMVGDQGVTVSDNRDSRWRPNLVGEVMAPPGVTVYYSTSGNPCRDVEGINPSGPAGCEAPNWSLIPPTDITSVQSLKFVFDGLVIYPNEEVLLEWPMRAPVNALDGLGVLPDSIAWNSFAYISTRNDNNQQTLPAEPLKVGIMIDPLIPNVYGDFVWIDTNMDGTQDVGESGINGVRVELFKDNGDGYAVPAQDTFINFTLTANGGYYLFPYLEDGDYYAVFFLPPNHQASPANQGSNDLDSDGFITTYNTANVAIVPVTTLSGNEFDYSWDQGIYPTPTASVGNYIWHDTNLDGIQNEPPNMGVNGILVNIYQSDMPVVPYASTTTTNGINGQPGYYFFDGLPIGEYFIEFVLPSGYSFTTQGSTGSDPNDSDPKGTGLSELFVLNAGDIDNNWDAGIIFPINELCDNGFDDDGDGLADCDDTDCICCASSAPTLSKN